MLQVGSIVHQAKSGRLVVKLSREVRAGAYLLDEKGKKLGRIVELIGPVKAPYASVAVSTSRLGKQGDGAFVEG